MGSLERINLAWPPVGWKQLAGIETSAGQSVAKDIGKARIYGLQYRIESVPLFKNNEKFYSHTIQIDGWEYSILNESIEYPVLSLTILDRFDMGLPKETFVCDIRSYASLIPHSKPSANRAINAALFFIRQIERGSVPDINRVLRIYKLHPNQTFLYREDYQERPDLKLAFGAGLPAGKDSKRF